MSLSFRKSINAGPFRLNFSKSGISYSMDIKGARVNIGPRGTFVNLSSHGITYQRRISGQGSHQPQSIPQIAPLDLENVHNIASADIEQLTDTDSADFISELTRKADQISYVNWFGILPLVFFLIILSTFSFSERTIITRPETDSTLVEVTSYVGVNIRKAAYPGSEILKAADYAATFPLIDSTNRKWLKIRFNDSEGYISRRFAAISHDHHDKVVETQTVLSNSYAGYELLAGIIGFVLLIRWLKKLDKKRFEMELHYNMDEQFQQIYQQFAQHFKTFSCSRRIWQYLNVHNTIDYKRNAGAGKLIKRVALRSISTDQKPMRYFITNVAIPYLKLSNIEFYFLPERLVVKRGSTFAALFYKNLRISGSSTRFIEEEGVAGDALVVDYTWKYVNKKGGPDRRFNNNRKLPICLYSEYALTSDTGIYEVITTSKQGAMDAFANFLMQIGKLQSRMAIQ